jgi:hypothetical protein
MKAAWLSPEVGRAGRYAGAVGSFAYTRFAQLRAMVEALNPRRLFAALAVSVRRSHQPRSANVLLANSAPNSLRLARPR